MFKHFLIIHCVLLLVPLLSAEPLALADDTSAPRRWDATKRRLEQLTHPFGTLGALQVDAWTYVGKFTLTDGTRAFDFYLYAKDSDDRKHGGRMYPNLFGLCAVYEDGMGKWSIETVYSGARVGFVRVVSFDKKRIDFELTTKFEDIPDFDEPDKWVKANNKTFMQRLRLENGKFVVSDVPSRTNN